MSLFEMTYPQADLASELQALDISLNGTIILPWTGSQITIMDENRNVIGYASENEMGGMTFTDESMNTIGSSISNPMGGDMIMDENFQHVGFTMENVHGGENLYSSEASLELITFNGASGGEEIYSSDMELLGISSEQLGEIHYSGVDDPSVFLEDVPSFDSLSDFAGSSLGCDFADGFTSLDFDFGIGEEALSIFDLF